MLQNIDTAILDIDGFIYDYDPSFIDICLQAAVDASAELLPSVAREQAIELANTSFDRFHDCFSAFLPLAEQNNIEREVLQGRFQTLYHQSKLRQTREQNHPALAPKNELVTLITKARELGIQFICVTHSDKKEWTCPAFERMGLIDLLPADLIIDYADSGYENRSNTPKAINMAMQMTGSTPERTLIADDGVINLELGKSVHPQITTVLKTATPVDHPQVDLVITSPVQLITKLIAARSEPIATQRTLQTTPYVMPEPLL